MVRGSNNRVAFYVFIYFFYGIKRICLKIEWVPPFSHVTPFQVQSSNSRLIHLAESRQAKSVNKVKTHRPWQAHSYSQLGKYWCRNCTWHHLNRNVLTLRLCCDYCCVSSSANICCYLLFMVAMFPWRHFLLYLFGQWHWKSRMGIHKLLFCCF